MNNFSDIVAFVRVVEAHSFVAAAQTLGMSPSAISKAVSRLEERLGARLLNRTTRSLSLTDLGTGFYERCREALGQLDQAENEVSESRGVPRGKLRVDVPISLGRKIIVPALPRFIEQNPELTVQMSMNDRVIDLVQEGIDAALRVGNLSDSSLIARRVGNLRGVTCASPEYIERMGGPPKSPEDLKPEQCIAMFRPGSNQIRDWMFRKEGVDLTIIPAAPLSFSDPESAVAAAVSGAGFVRTLDFTAEAQIASGLLQPVLEDWNDGAWWPVSVVYPQHRQPTAKIRAFIEFVSGLFPQVTPDRVPLNGADAAPARITRMAAAAPP
ncbi:LysR family transcriptional regulator [Steroidobacter agaridevorans]|uniref:LysR family transcriptional regulator n=1 Tax=Steroidobacter agaridevorans TaxID=2695856 RepID=A0A829Y4U4_9GAMM|nr:LysR family transcriptional regulator [Steroidobacter agaridevorans]GFE78204.1 LysR family transcriptional regulator [Steroidobacter agaridevorans]GFE91263.1 LysR family transcriptional regulator [Steroidobacter agaridevorans]